MNEQPDDKQGEQRKVTTELKNLFRNRDGKGWLDRLFVPLLVAASGLYAIVQVLQGDWLGLVIAAIGVGVLVVFTISQPIQQRFLGAAFDNRHALYVTFVWVYSELMLWSLRVMGRSPSSGKGSQLYVMMLLLSIAIALMIARALFALTPTGHRVIILPLPIWEQILVAVNELAAAALLAYVSAGALTRALQPEVFSVRVDPLYTGGLLALVSVYYLVMWVMWFKVGNDLLSKNDVWVGAARLVAPLALLVISLMINKRFADIGDPRTADLLGHKEFDTAVLAIAPVVWLLVLVVIFLVFTSRRGLRRRFLPDMLLDRLPNRLNEFLRTISDMDIVLMIGVLTTSIPVYIFLRGNSGGVVGTLREQILQRGDVLINSAEQALALLFALPFYALVVALLVIYAIVLANPNVSADDREDLIKRLPVSFLIVLIITLYLFAVSFSQVLTEGRLPRLPQDLGRILAFDILIPLVLLYFHYFVSVRVPYGRGQARWRIRREANLSRELGTLDWEMRNLDRDLARLDRAWHGGLMAHSEPDQNARFNALYEFVDLNGRRDKLNMKRLEILGEQQRLAQVSEAPFALAVARLPVRVVTIGIPLLLAIQVYQWAVLNDGLRQIANDPNITIVEFFQTILKQVNF